MATYGRSMEVATLTPIAGEKAENTEPLLLRVEEVAKLLACSKSQIYAMAKSGELPGVVKLGKAGVRVSKAALIAWINSGGIEDEDLARRRALIMAAKR